MASAFEFVHHFRANGLAGDSLSGVGEHLQQRDSQRPKVRGINGCGDVGCDLYPPRLLCPPRIRLYPQDHSGGKEEVQRQIKKSRQGQ